MQTIHVLLGAAAATGLIAAALPGSRMSARQPGGRLIGLVVFGAAAVGHGASLLPGTPRWYGIAVTIATLVALAWAVRCMLPERAEPRHADEYASRYGNDDGPRYGSGLTHIVDAEVVDAEVIDADVMADDDDLASVTSLSDRRSQRMPIATQQTFAAAGPPGGATTMGSTYVAANLSDYLRDRNRGGRLGRSAHTVHATRSARAARAKRYPDLRHRLLRIYGIEKDPRGGNVSAEA